MRGHLGEEIDMLPRRIGAGSVAPDDDRQLRLFAKHVQVIWAENGVSGNRTVRDHQRLVFPGPAILYCATGRLRRDCCGRRIRTLRVTLAQNRHYTTYHD